MKAELRRSDVETIVKDYLASHPEEVRQIVREYLAKNPEVLRDAFAELIKRRALAAGATGNAQTPDQAAAIQTNARAVVRFATPSSSGEPAGQRHVGGVFDHNCGYCKRALGDTLVLLKGRFRSAHRAQRVSGSRFWIA